MTNIAIIGAGLSGLTVAHQLKDHAKITVFEKARGVGGRMSTRRQPPYAFDHGAQFFTVTTERFAQFIQPMIEQGVVARWDARFVQFKQDKRIAQHQWGALYPHYVGVPGMNALCKYLADDMNVQLNTRVKAIEFIQEQWMLLDEDGELLGYFDWLIIAIPSAQALSLLPQLASWNVQIQLAFLQPCFTLMFGLEKPLSIGFDIAAVDDSLVQSIAVNSAKPGRSQPMSLVVQSANRWASEQIYKERHEIVDCLYESTCDLVNQRINPSYLGLHRWLYASIEQKNGADYIFYPQEKLGVCGDWFIQGRVEAAFTSGFLLAEQWLQEA